MLNTRPRTEPRERVYSLCKATGPDMNSRLNHLWTPRSSLKSQSKSTYTYMSSQRPAILSYFLLRDHCFNNAVFSKDENCMPTDSCATQSDVFITLFPKPVCQSMGKAKEKKGYWEARKKECAFAQVRGGWCCQVSSRKYNPQKLSIVNC